MPALALTAATQAPHGVALLTLALDQASRTGHPVGPLLALLPLLGLLALGYTRIAPARAGDNPVRRALLEALATGRCFTASDLARAVGVSRKTVAYHLRILERAGMVARRGLAGRAVYVGPGHAHRASAAERLLEHPRRRGVWEAARASPGATVPELARALGMKPGTAYFHARVLARAGLFERVDFGGVRGFIAAQPLPGEAPPRDGVELPGEA